MRRIKVSIIFGAILLTRASLEASISAIREIGIGAALNAIVIIIGCTFVLARGLRTPGTIIGTWVVFLAACVIFSIVSPVPIQFARTFFWLLTYFLVSVIPYYLIKTARDRDALVDLVIYSSLVPALVGAVQIATGFGKEEFRVPGTFTHANIFGFYILVVLAAILLKMNSLRRGLTVQRLVIMGYATALCALLVYTKSRGAWLGAFILFVSYGLLVDRRKLPLLIVILPVILLLPSVQERLLDATSEAEHVGHGVILNSYEWRKALWDQAFAWIENRPLSGHGGLGTFAHYAPQFFTYLPDEWESTDAHNVYVQLLFEIGVLGPLLFAAILIAHALRFLQAVKSDKLYGGLGAGLCSIYIFVSYFDNVLHYLTFNWYFWFLLGIMGAWTELARKERGRSAFLEHARRVEFGDECNLTANHEGNGSDPVR